MCQEVVKTIQTCEDDEMQADWKKLEAITKLFESPMQLSYRVGKNVMVNGSDIYKEVFAAIEEYEQSNWNDFGVEIGKALAHVLIGDLSTIQVKALSRSGDISMKVYDMNDLQREEWVKTTSKKLADEFEGNRMAADVVSGFLKGADIGEFGHHKILMCMLKSKFSDKFNVFASNMNLVLEEHDPEDQNNGFIHSVVFMDAFRDQLQGCSNVQDSSADWNKYNMIMDGVEQTFVVEGRDIMYNRAQITKDVQMALDLWKEGQHEDYGVAVGRILNQVPRPAFNDTDPSTHIY